MDPHKFKGELTFYYIEDANGSAPKSFEHLKAYIPLECEVKEGNMTLFGRTSPYKAKCFDLKLNNHNYGIYFDVSHQGEKYKDKIIWRRAVDSRFLSTFFQELCTDEIVATLHGDAPEVPNCPPSVAHLKCVREKHDFRVESFSLTISLDTFKLFCNRYEE